MHSKSYYKKLIASIARHDKLYFSQNNPEITDIEYDTLVALARKIEEEHPDWITETPLNRIFSDTSRGFHKVRHEYPILSLNNTYSKEEVSEFMDRMDKMLGKKVEDFHVEVKIDGVALVVRYDNGELISAVTRGDGEIGDDVSENVISIGILPKKISYKLTLHIRGEVYLDKAQFILINEKRKSLGEDIFANPRNFAAGSLKLLDPKEVSRRGLSMIFYDILNGGFVDRQSQVYEILSQEGIPTFLENQKRLCSSKEELFDYLDEMERCKEDLPFIIDGMVVKVDLMKDRESVGQTIKSPKGAIAYKFKAKSVESVIEDIILSVGRSGVVTPVAILKPTTLDGSTISRATLHNEEEIYRKDFRIGDSVVIEKSGEVIPKVLSVVFDKRPKSSKKWSLPTHCPSCSSKLYRLQDEVAIRCPNDRCPEKMVRVMEFFVSKGCANIYGLGFKALEKLFINGIISDIPDIYKLSRESLSKIDGFQDKSITKLLRSIEASKKMTLGRFIFSLGIPMVGSGTANMLANHFGNLDNFVGASKGELLSIDSIGDRVASSIITFLDRDKLLIDKLLLAGVQVTSTSSDLRGKLFVITGKFNNYSREEIKSILENHGGYTSDIVSKKTDCLLCGSSPGSKLDKAKKLDVTILDEKASLDLLNNIEN